MWMRGSRAGGVKTTADGANCFALMTRTDIKENVK